MARGRSGAGLGARGRALGGRGGQRRQHERGLPRARQGRNALRQAGAADRAARRELEAAARPRRLRGRVDARRRPLCRAADPAPVPLRPDPVRDRDGGAVAAHHHAQRPDPRHPLPARGRSGRQVRGRRDVRHVRPRDPVRHALRAACRVRAQRADPAHQRRPRADRPVFRTSAQPAHAGAGGCRGVDPGGRQAARGGGGMGLQIPHLRAGADPRRPAFGLGDGDRGRFAGHRRGVRVPRPDRVRLRRVHREPAAVVFQPARARRTRRGSHRVRGLGAGPDRAVLARVPRQLPVVVAARRKRGRLPGGDVRRPGRAGGAGGGAAGIHRRRVGGHGRVRRAEDDPAHSGLRARRRFRGHRGRRDARGVRTAGFGAGTAAGGRAVRRRCRDRSGRARAYPGSLTRAPALHG